MSPRRIGAENLTPEQRRLADAMSEISEEYYCAGWLHDLEYEIWGMLTSGPRDFGLGRVSDEELEQLRRLSDACGGWIEWVSTGDPFTSGEAFVPLAEWRERYAAASRSAPAEAPRG